MCLLDAPYKPVLLGTWDARLALVARRTTDRDSEAPASAYICRGCLWQGGGTWGGFKGRKHHDRGRQKVGAVLVCKDGAHLHPVQHLHGACQNTLKQAMLVINAPGSNGYVSIYL